MRTNIISCTPAYSYSNNYKLNKFNKLPAFNGRTNISANASEMWSAKFRDFSIQEYKKLSPQEINSINSHINELYSSVFDEILKYHDIAAEYLKNNLDSAFGRDKYVVIPIGRSLSSIGKCLGYKIGEDNVKNMPMSTASRFLDIERRHENFNAFRQYLDSIGLSQKEIETSDKTYIFTDFCHTGASILGVERLFNYKIWGKHNNVRFVNILDLLRDNSSDKINNDIFVNNLIDMLHNRDFKLYSFVKPCQNLANTQLSIVNTAESPLSVKSFWFKLLDYEVKQNHLSSQSDKSD